LAIRTQRVVVAGKDVQKPRCMAAGAVFAVIAKIDCTQEILVSQRQPGDGRTGTVSG